MRRLPVFMILLGCILQACNQNEDSFITRLDESKISKQELTKQLEDLINAADVHGLGVTLFQDKKIQYKETFGFKNYRESQPLLETTNIYGASLSKAVFAVLVMQLVEDQVIDLDTPLESYLPKRIYEYSPLTQWHDDYSSLKEDSLYHLITARMCLSNSSGFPNWRWFEPDQKLRVKFQPGSRYFYSGEGFVFLQMVLEKILNQNLEQLAQDKIFKPLGMKKTSYQWNTSFERDFAHGHQSNGSIYSKDIDNEPRGASTLETTLYDYSLFLSAVLHQKILSESSWNELFTAQIPIRSLRQFGPLSSKDSTLNESIKLSYGLGWGLLETPFGRGAFKEGHGDGFQHYSIVFPSLGKGILIMTNSDNGESIFKDLLEIAIADTYTPWEWQNYIPYYMLDRDPGKSK